MANVEINMVDVDGLTVANTLLFTTITKFSPLSASLVITSTDEIRLDCAVSIGTKAPDYDDIMKKTMLTDVPSVDTSLVIVGGTDIYVRVSQVGAAQTLTFKAGLIGYNT